MQDKQKNKKTIFLRNHDLMIRIGVHPHEKEHPQQVRINVEIDLENKKENDCLEQTFDYETLHSFISDLGRQFSCNLQETLARKILEFILPFQTVLSVTVEVSKPDAFKDCESVGVRFQAFSSVA